MTWSTDSTIASITPPSDVLPKASRSSAHHGVPNPLTRTQSLLPSLSHRIDVVPRGELVLRGDRVLDVEHDDVGAGCGRGCEAVVLRAVDKQPTAGEYRVDARSRRRNPMVCSGLVVHQFMVAHRCGTALPGVSPGARRRTTPSRPNAAAPRRRRTGALSGTAKPCAGGVELDGVLDARRGQRLVQRLGVLGGERRVVLGAADVDRGLSSGRRAGAGCPGRRPPGRRRGTTSPRPPARAPGRPPPATSARPCSSRWCRTSRR